MYKEIKCTQHMIIFCMRMGVVMKYMVKSVYLCAEHFSIMFGRVWTRLFYYLLRDRFHLLPSKFRTSTETVRVYLHMIVIISRNLKSNHHEENAFNLWVMTHDIDIQVEAISVPLDFLHMILFRVNHLSSHSQSHKWHYKIINKIVFQYSKNMMKFRSQHLQIILKQKVEKNNRKINLTIGFSVAFRKHICTISPEKMNKTLFFKHCLM